MKIGSVIQVKSFHDYYAKAPLDAEDGYMMASEVPAGTFVCIESAKGLVVGIVTGVLHSVREDLLPYVEGEKREVFFPYMADMRSSYLIIKGIGSMGGNVALQDVSFAPCINDVVRIMERDEVRAFHKQGFTYYRSIQKSIEPVALSKAIDMLMTSMPEAAPMLKALKRYTENRA